MNVNERLNQIEERLKNCTPGPWGIGWCSEIDERAEIVTQFKGKHPEPTLFVLGEIAERKNQALIANAPADLAWLISEVKRLEAESKHRYDWAIAVQKKWAEANENVERLTANLRLAVEALEFYAKGFTSFENVKENAKPPGWKARETLAQIAKGE